MIVAALAGGLLLDLLAYLALPREIRRDPLNPAAIVMAAICVLTVGRAVYVLAHGAFFLTFDIQFPLATHGDDFAFGVFAQLAGVGLFTLAVAVVYRRFGVDRASAPADAEPSHWDERPLRIGLVVGALITLAALLLLVREAGGPHQYLDALRNRQFFFQHEGPLFVALSAFPAAVLAWFAVNAAPGRSRRWWIQAGLLLAAAALSGVAGGARSPLVFLFLLPVLLIVHWRVRRLSWRIIAVVALVVFLAVSAFRAVARDSSASASRDLYSHGMTGFFTNAFASPDSRLPDTIAALRAESVPSKRGATLLGALAAPVPRALWAGKPRSGNEALSAALYPGSFKPALGLTFAGEAVWSFGWAGLSLFAVLGGAVGAAYTAARRRPADPLLLVAYAAAIGTMLVIARADLFDGTLGFVKAFVPALGLLGLSAWLGEWQPPWQPVGRRVRAGLQYLGMTFVGRGAVFGGLLVAAAVLPVGAYALFALGYQIALFVGYQIAYPFNVAGYRLGAHAHRSAIAKRLALVPLIGAAVAAPLALALVPGHEPALVASTSVFAAASSLAVVALGQAQAFGRALSFARWNAVGSLGFLALAGLMGSPSAELLAATAGMIVAPLVLASRLDAIATEGGERPIGRPELTVFLANLAFSFAFVVFLALVNAGLANSDADRVALLFTLLQAALVIPLQLVSLVQPRLIAHPSEELRHVYSSTQSTLAMTMMLTAFMLATALAVSGWTGWSTVAPLAASVVPVGLGLAGASSLLVAEGPGLRLLTGPAAFTGVLCIAGLLVGSHPQPAELTYAWFFAATLGSVTQAFVLREKGHAQSLAIGLLAGTTCLGVGALNPLLGGLVALTVLLADHRAIRAAMLSGGEFVAVHR